MKLESVRVRGLGPYGDFAVDLSKLTGPLVAICGPNGAGKSTLLELAIPGAAYRSTPTRGSLADLATARDSLLESRLVYGEVFSIRHVIDKVTGKSEAAVFGADGAPLLPDTKVRSYERWAARVLPAPEVLFAAMFRIQGSDGFLGMKPGERKAVLLRALGVERLEVMAERAREHVKATKAALATLDARIADERARSGADEAEAAADAARRATVEASQALTVARAELERVEAERRRLEQEERERVAVEAQRWLLTEKLNATQAKLGEIEARVTNNRAVLGEAEQIRAAVSRVAELTASIAELEQKERDRQAVAAESARLSAEVATELAKVKDLEVRIANNRAVLAEEAAITAAVAEAANLRDRVAKTETELAEQRTEAAKREAERDGVGRELAGAGRSVVAAQQRLLAPGGTLAEGALDAARESLAAAVEELAAAEVELGRLRGQRVAGAEDRIGALRSGLGAIASGAKGAAKAAQATLDQDDATANAAAELPGAVQAAEWAVEGARKRKLNAEDYLADCERRAANLAQVEAARADLKTAETEAAAIAVRLEAAKTAAEQSAWDVDRLFSEAAGLRARLVHVGVMEAKAEPLARAQTRLAELEPQLETARAAAQRLTDAIGALPTPVAPHQPAIDSARRELADIEPLAAKALPLERAEVRLAELEPQVEEARGERDRLDAALAELPEPSEPRVLPELDPLRDAVTAAEAADRQAHSAVAVAEQRLETARTAAGRIAELGVERARLDAELSDWLRLAADLGRDGLQAAEIDAAGPELTELVNDLLHSCVGPRFSVAIETTKLSADGKRQLEGCEVRVIDTLRGRDAEASTFSGGERVIIGEAVSLALSMLACRRAGLEGVTLVRDESGAALDPVNARAYVAMLRRAAQIVRADKVLFVSHSPEVIELADDRIEIPAPESARAEAAE